MIVKQNLNLLRLVQFLINYKVFRISQPQSSLIQSISEQYEVLLIKIKNFDQYKNNLMLLNIIAFLGSLPNKTYGIFQHKNMLDNFIALATDQQKNVLIIVKFIVYYKTEKLNSQRLFLDNNCKIYNELIKKIELLNSP